MIVILFTRRMCINILATMNMIKIFCTRERVMECNVSVQLVHARAAPFDAWLQEVRLLTTGALSNLMHDREREP